MPAPPRPPRGRCRHRADGHPGVSPADHRDAPSDPAPGVEGRRGGRGASAVVRPEVTGGWGTEAPMVDREPRPAAPREPPAARARPLRRRGHAGARWPWWGSHPAAGSTSCSSGAGHPVAGGRLLPAGTSMARHPDPVRGMAHRAACDREITWGSRCGRISATTTDPRSAPGGPPWPRVVPDGAGHRTSPRRPPPGSASAGTAAVRCGGGRGAPRPGAAPNLSRFAEPPPGGASSRALLGIRGEIRGCIDSPHNVIHPTLPSVTPPAYEVPTATRVGVGAFPSEP